MASLWFNNSHVKQQPSDIRYKSKLSFYEIQQLRDKSLNNGEQKTQPLNIEGQNKEKRVRLQQRPLLSISFTSVKSLPSPPTTNKSVAQQTKGATNWKSVGKLENIIRFLSALSRGSYRLNNSSARYLESSFRSKGLLQI